MRWAKRRDVEGVLKTTPLADKDTVYRQDIMGETGQIYGQPDHMHFEIYMDDANIELLLGHKPSEHPKADVMPTVDVRTDVVFGSSYEYLPANTPVLDAEPSQQIEVSETKPLGTALWVQMDYNADSATLTSYYAKVDADFPAFLDWQFIDDDWAGDSGADQRCDSEKLRKLLLDAIEDADAKTKAQAKTSEGGQDSYFNKYESGTDQGTKLRNTQKGDGILFKDRGIIQLTERGNYTSHGNCRETQYLDSSTAPPLGQVAYLTTDAGGFYWATKQKYIEEKDNKTNKKLVKSGEQGINYLYDQGTSKENAKEVTKRINPAALHFEEMRWPCFEHALYVLNDATTPPDNFKPIAQ